MTNTGATTANESSGGKGALGHTLNGGGLGAMLVEASQFIPDDFQKLFLAFVPTLSILGAYCITLIVHLSDFDIALFKARREFNKTEKGLRKKLKRADILEEEKEIIRSRLVALQEVRSKAEVQRIEDGLSKAGVSSAE